MEGFFNFVALDSNIRYTLGKFERLKSRKDIELIFATGKSCSAYPLKLLYLLGPINPLALGTLKDNKGNQLQAGFTVSSRNFKKAVDRNRIKRLMRECYRLKKNLLAESIKPGELGLRLFIIYVGKEVPTYQVVDDQMTKLLMKLNAIVCAKN